MKKSRFKKRESFKHKLAIELLNDWIKKDYIRTVIEESYCMGGIMWFVGDLSCYDENGLSDIYEVVWRNEVSIIKQWRMYMFFKWHKWNVNVWRVDADWLLNQTSKPNYINKMNVLNPDKNIEPTKDNPPF